jgi:hypothetical protein
VPAAALAPPVAGAVDRRLGGVDHLLAAARRCQPLGHRISYVLRRVDAAGADIWPEALVRRRVRVEQPAVDVVFENEARRARVIGAALGSHEPAGHAEVLREDVSLDRRHRVVVRRKRQVYAVLLFEHAPRQAVRHQLDLRWGHASAQQAREERTARWKRTGGNGSRISSMRRMPPQTSSAREPESVGKMSPAEATARFTATPGAR